MSFLSFETVKGFTFDEAAKVIKSHRTPKTIEEYREEHGDGKAHIGVQKHYESQAIAAGAQRNYGGLYFFITKKNEFHYIGKSNHMAIMNRVREHSGKDIFKECYVSILDVPLSISKNNDPKHEVVFFEAVFIALYKPEGNDTGKGFNYDFLREKKITLGEILQIRPNCNA